jgi:hypothetical protein
VVVQAGAAGTPAVAAQQVGGDAAFVEKHILTRVVKREPVTPVAPLGRHVRAPLFVGVYGFF